MINNLHIVVDTNILISGLFGIKDSPSFQILSAIRREKIILVTTQIILKEVNEVINRERIIKLTKMTAEDRANFINGLIEKSYISKGKQLSEIVSRDIKDDKFLACAIEGNADYIVTGDKDLLVLKEYKGTKITTPREFMDILQVSKPS